MKSDGLSRFEKVGRPIHVPRIPGSSAAILRNSLIFNPAPGRTRTYNQLIKSQLLYH